MFVRRRAPPGTLCTSTTARPEERCLELREESAQARRCCREVPLCVYSVPSSALFGAGSAEVSAEGFAWALRGLRVGSACCCDGVRVDFFSRSDPGAMSVASQLEYDIVEERSMVRNFHPSMLICAHRAPGIAKGVVVKDTGSAGVARRAAVACTRSRCWSVQTLPHGGEMGARQLHSP